MALGNLIHYYLEDEICGGIIKWPRNASGMNEASVLAHVGTYIVAIVASAVVLFVGAICMAVLAR